MSKQDPMKIQSCVLRVNIHCDGCKHKVEKRLRKIEGVYKVSTDVEKGKVTVSGNVDPLTLIEKLEKAGKHAELLGAQKPPISIMNNQFNNIQFEKGNGGKGNKGQKGGFQVPNQVNMKKDLKEVKFPGKNKKSVKFDLPEPEEFDDDDDEDEDSFEDDSDEGFAAPQRMPSKVAPVAGRGGNLPQGIKQGSDGPLKGKNGGNGKKGSRFDMFVKSILGKAAVGKKIGNAESNLKKGGKLKEGEKNSWFVPGEGKNSAKKGKVDGGEGGGGGGKIKGGWGKKHDESFEIFPKMESKQGGMNNGNANPRLGGGRNGGQMAFQPTNFQAVQGLPAAGGMNAGNFQGMGQGNNPYNQQQYMQQMMMMMNQQRGNGQGGNHHPGPYMQPAMSGYGHPGQGGYHHHPAAYMQPAMNYGPPPPPTTERYTHMFSDENTDSCSIM